MRNRLGDKGFNKRYMQTYGHVTTSQQQHEMITIRVFHPLNTSTQLCTYISTDRRQCYQYCCNVFRSTCNKTRLQLQQASLNHFFRNSLSYRTACTTGQRNRPQHSDSLSTSEAVSMPCSVLRTMPALLCTQVEVVGWVGQAEQGPPPGRPAQLEGAGWAVARSVREPGQELV